MDQPFNIGDILLANPKRCQEPEIRDILRNRKLLVTGAKPLNDRGRDDGFNHYVYISDLQSGEPIPFPTGSYENGLWWYQWFVKDEFLTLAYKALRESKRETAQE